MFLKIDNTKLYLKALLINLIKLLPKYIKQGLFSLLNNEIKFSKKYLYDFIYILKSHTLFKLNTLNDIVGLDLKNKKRFTIKYIVTSTRFNYKIRLSTIASEYEALPTITKLYPGANWVEREVWDLFGIFFWKHNDLRRILTDYGFKGFPLRKDFPLIGFLEVSYDIRQKKIKYVPNFIFQEYRFFFSK
jgi:NADH:ubiquinone oxidoreductase subunit C